MASVALLPDVRPVPARTVQLPARVARFPSRDLVGMAAATLADSAGQTVWTGEEGPRWFVTVSPGSVRIGTCNLGKAQLADEREHQVRVKVVDLLAAQAVDGVLPDDEDSEPGRFITAWSRKSRANMTRRLVTFDYNEMAGLGDLVVITLTYPGEWLSVAPDAKAVKRHFEKWRRRWERKWGKIFAVWKLEYQRRGAPHYHLLVPRPAGVEREAFRKWVADSWADSIKHGDPEQARRGRAAGTRVDEAEGARMLDPRRIGVYFSKHGLFAAKDYQNDPPQEWIDNGGGVGRFWGYWGLRPAEVSAEVTPQQGIGLARFLRRLNRQNRYLRPVTVQRVDQLTGQVRLRTCRRPVHRMPGSRGFVVANDGPGLAMLLDRVLWTIPSERRASDFDSQERPALHGPWQ